ncbi:TonB-dependent receptor [Hymenobacter jeollabukensis]|uniref:TonB-dependent receptor n=1 Tax=Hymenobacter jeollabukensis TaxID=2025313 RepID=A0A5R8WNH9_9BACT|nr:hypothetical protein [Hymenobacter jeollabukensis]TLM91637.1 hypothetical protein FDY95_13825 [Hymenobacter jeollabukensis]
MSVSPSQRLALTALLATAAGATLAQGQPTKPRTRGTIEDAEIEVVKERENQLPEAARNYDKVELPAPTKADRVVKYTFPDFRLPSQNLNPTVRVLTIKQEELAPLQGNYARLGVGNYASLFGEAHAHTTRNEDHALGLDLRHLSSARGPVDGKNSAVSQSRLGLNGELYRGAVTLGANVKLGRDRANFYGYNPTTEPKPSPDSIKQTFFRTDAQVFVRNRDRDAKFQYDLAGGYRYWKDRFEAKESDLYAQLRTAYYVTEKGRVRLDGDLSFISQKDSAFSVSRPFVQATAQYEQRIGDRLDVGIGATLGYTGDTINDAKQVTVFPAIRVGYAVVQDKFVLFGGLGGGLQRVTLYDLSQENAWLGKRQQVADTRRGPSVFFGFNAAPARALQASVKVTLANDYNLYFYNNSRRDSSRFDLVYNRDGSTQLVNVHGELIYNAAEKLRIGTKVDYNGYKVKTLAKPFHRPNFQGVFFGSYNMNEKLMLGGELYVLNSSYGSTLRRSSLLPLTYTETVQKTDAVIDLNLRADYRFSENLSFFVLGNNLLGRKYERFLNYPSKGVNVLVGAGYQF